MIDANGRPPLLIAVDMGYGHLRAAHALAAELGVEVQHADRPPLAGADEQRLWARARRVYELTSRATQLPVVGSIFRSALDAVTSIPHLHPYRDLSDPTRTVRFLDAQTRRGLGRGLIERLARTEETVLTTFFAPAVVADRSGHGRIFCVVTDADLSRVWVKDHPPSTRVTYLVPSQRASRRLRSYGVPPHRIRFTGFPLPPERLGGPDLPILRRDLAARLVRLDPGGVFREQHRGELDHFLGALPLAATAPPLVVYAVGGAGAQAELARRFLPKFRQPIEAGRVRLALVAGVRDSVAADFRAWIAEAGLEPQIDRGISVLHEPDVERYFARFNDLIGGADVLWTKPSELTFFGGLGLPLVLSSPVGVHESYNRRWAREHGAALKQRDVVHAAEWMLDWLEDGTLAAAAWAGFLRLPKFGTYRIVEALRS